MPAIVISAVMDQKAQDISASGTGRPDHGLTYALFPQHHAGISYSMRALLDQHFVDAGRAAPIGNGHWAAEGRLQRIWHLQSVRVVHGQAPAQTLVPAAHHQSHRHPRPPGQPHVLVRPFGRVSSMSEFHQKVLVQSAAVSWQLQIDLCVLMSTSVLPL